MRVIRHAKVYGEDHRFHEGDLYMDGERLCPVSDQPVEEEHDANGLYALPGLVDLHFHGAVGHDLCDADEAGLQAIADAQHGILAICPATMTYPETVLSTIMRSAADHVNGHGADLVGINMEGPFISPKKVGAQDPRHVTRADKAMFDRLQAASNGLIKLVDIAPEMPGHLDFIREVSAYVRVSLAHTETTYETAVEAFRAGAKQLTHTYNAMPALESRKPGPIAAAAECGGDAELITDGIHIHPAMVRLLFKLFGPEHMLLISDSMRACGLPDGEYTLGGQAVTVCGKRAVLTDYPGVIAGSVTCLYDCMKESVLKMDIPLEDAVRAASENPAKALGIDADYGQLKAGTYANVLLTDRELNLKAIFQKGQRIK